MPRESFTALYFAAIVALGGFLFGFDATVISGVVGFVRVEFDLNDWQVGLVVGAPTLAGILAAVTVGPLADLVGRKRMLQVLAAVYTVSAIFSALAPDFLSLVLARAIGGFAFGSLGLAPIYISETSPARHRGFLVSVNQFNIVIGFSAAYFANYFLLQVSQSPAGWVGALAIDRETWRWMLGIEAVPAVGYFFLLFLVPESPRWLFIKQRQEEARRVLARITVAAQLEDALEEIRRSTADAAQKLWSRIALLKRPAIRLPLILGLIVGIAQQASGINAVYFYAPTIFEQSGVGTDAAFAQAIWIGLINIVFTLAAMALMDRLGRKPLLMAGLCGVVVSMSISAYGFNQATYRLDPQAVAALSETIDGERLGRLAGVTFDSDVAFKSALRAEIGDGAFKAHEAAFLQAATRVDARLIMIGILGFVASFAFSLGPVMWVLLPEIFPNAVRAVAMAVVGFFNSLVSFGVQFLFPVGLTHIGSAGTFITYAGLSLIALVLVARLLPETKGRSLEQLEAEFAARA